MTPVRYRIAGSGDAAPVAHLHADSWRRHYRGAYADSFLDGDVAADRRAVWSARLAGPANSRTVLAEDDTGPVGFVHVVFDDDERWGSLIDNLHVAVGRQRGGIGTALMARAATAVAEQAANPAMYLWVLEQNTAAQQFYRALGGTVVEKALVPPPGGVAARLNGSPGCYRFAWPDATPVADLLHRSP
jgi:ribosomal protein S18 acetylase RimI-like enzyme